MSAQMNRQVKSGNGSNPMADDMDQTGEGRSDEIASLDQVRDMMSDPGFLSSRHEKSAITAYYKAERRGFATSGELEDWLEAEREVDRNAKAAANNADYTVPPLALRTLR